MIVHPIPPLYAPTSDTLILGSFPSVKSREQGFFYGHPQNRFWRVMAAVCDSGVPTTIEEKRRLILTNHYALWDVIRSCEIDGSSDSSIRAVTPNRLTALLEQTAIRRIFVNGKKAEALYIRYLEKETGLRARVLPSTSPANAAKSLDDLIRIWREELVGARQSDISGSIP